MKLFALTCALSGSLFLASGCATSDTPPTAQGESTEAIEKHEVMKPVVTDETPGDNGKTEEEAPDSGSTSEKP